MNATATTPATIVWAVARSGHDLPDGAQGPEAPQQQEQPGRRAAPPRAAGSNRRAPSDVGLPPMSSTIAIADSTSTGSARNSAQARRPATRWPRPGKMALRSRSRAADGVDGCGVVVPGHRAKDRCLAGIRANAAAGPSRTRGRRRGCDVLYGGRCDAADPPARPRTGALLVAVFWVTQLVETLGVSQVYALLPSYLREMGVPEADRLPFIGLFSSLVFVLGLPLVPLWGVWADKISRKAVIVRSALVLECVSWASPRSPGSRGRWRSRSCSSACSWATPA